MVKFVRIVFKRLLKLTVWISVSLILLLLCLFLIIHIPAVQQQLVQKTTAWLKNKTGTEIRIKHIDLRIPKSLVLEGVYIQDLSRDTLVSAGTLEVNISVADLLQKKITLNSVSLTDGIVRLHRKQGEDVYNFDFLANAFKSTDTKTYTSSGRKDNLNVDKVTVSRADFILDDEKTGLYTRYRVKQLSVTMDKLGINTSDFRAHSIEIDGLKGELVQYKRNQTTDSSPKKTKLPFASARLIKIRNSSFVYEDKTVKQYVQSNINNLQLEDGEVDLNKQTVKAKSILLEKSFGRVGLTFQARKSNGSLPEKAEQKIQQGWSVEVKEINLVQNNFGYNVLNAEPKTNTFDANHINYENISLAANNFFYSADKLQAKVVSFSAIDPNSFVVRNFSTSFLMTPTSIEGKDITLKTNQSSFKGDGRIDFRSRSSIADSLPGLGLYTSIKQSEVATRELTWFAPSLREITFFNTNNVLKAKGEIHGQLNNIITRGLAVQTGNATYLYTRGGVKGLPDIKNSFFDIEAFSIKTSKQDIHTLTGKSSFNSIQVPETLNLAGTFKGSLRNFSSLIKLQSDFGNIDANALVDEKENFKASIVTEKFQLGRLLNSKLFGAVTASANVQGQGLDTQRVKAHVELVSSEFAINNYTYHDIALKGDYSEKVIDACLTVNDSNLAVKSTGYINMNKGAEQYKINMNLEGADLKKMNLVDRDIRIAFEAVSDIKGSDMNSINGKAGITKIILASNGKKYILDSLLFAAINDGGNSEMNLTSAIVGINYKGTFAPGDLVKELKHNLNNYFSFEENNERPQLKGPQQFSFNVTFNNHPVLQEVLFPGLEEFDPGTITGSYKSENKKLQLDGEIRRLIYKTSEIRGLVASVNSDEQKLAFNIKSEKLANSKIKFDNVLLDGKFENQSAYATLSSIDDDGNKKLLLSTALGREGNNVYKLTLDPKEFILVNEPWSVSTDNYVLFGKEGILFHNLSLSKNGSAITINTPSMKPGGDAHITLSNFKLDDISRIIEKDTALVTGIANGATILKRVNNTYAFESDLKIKGLGLRQIAIGDLDITANNIVPGKYALDLTLGGSGNNLRAKGTYAPGNSAGELDMNLNLAPLTAQSLEAFSFGQIHSASGNLTGNFQVKGKVLNPIVTGQLLFDQVTLTPAYLNTPLYFKSETINLQPGTLAFNSFTMLDKNNNPAVINGTIAMKELKDFKFALTINTTDFMLLNTTHKDNEQYFGTMIVDSRLRVKGTLDYPIITSSVKLKKGSYFTFAAIESKLSADRGENIVVFDDSTKLNPILRRSETKQRSVSTLKHFDISSTVEIDKKATIRLMLDPGTNDSLVVRGEAALSFGLDPSGKMSLTGVYNLTEGSYVVSLENVIRKKFRIAPGSTITWNGDPLDAFINLNAIYFTRTTPVDLVAGQVTNAELANYRQRYGFDVILKLRGPILTPDISFEIQLEQGQKGAVGGTINGKLEQLNDNPSALNKQVFALLVLNRFIQENPLETETNAGENAARTTVGKFLSAQLNQLTSHFVPGVDINFDVQSYNDYSSGKSEGRTQVGVGVSKQLFDERLTVQVGGAVDVEGEKAKQNTATDITGDVIVEYKLTKNGRYRLKGFRNNQYQGALEGQIIQTGAGILYVRDFNEWIQLFQKEKKESNEEDLNAQAWDTK